MQGQYETKISKRNLEQIFNPNMTPSEIIRFLEEDGEITAFLSHVDALVDTHVDRFIERGFTHLSVCFGCTGGQHRSVYSAQHVAEHLHEKFNVNVRLIHREQHIEKFFESKASL